jgi:hypothetical protein
VFWGWELGEHFELEMNAGVLFGASPIGGAIAAIDGRAGQRPQMPHVSAFSIKGPPQA